MSFSENFSAGQTPTNPSIVVIVDTSVGSDILITGRKVTITNAAGEYLVPNGTTTDFVLWSISDSSISLDILSVDQSVSIKVDWLNVSGVAIYSLTQQFCLSMFNKQFFYSLVSAQGQTPSIPQDSNYSFNMALFWATLNGAIAAVEIGDDIAGSQSLLNQCNYMQTNQSLYF